MSSSYIPFRLRHSKDDDIKNWISEELERAAAQEVEMDRSDVIRAALRFYFRHKNSLPNRHEKPAQGNETMHIDLQRTPLHESIQENPTQRKEAVKFQPKPTAPAAPYIAKPKP